MTSRSTRAFFAELGIAQSFSRPRTPTDNATAESWMATLKRDLVHRDRYPTRAAARTAVFEFIEVFYNRRRLHSTIGYRSPAEFERTTRIERERATVG